MKERKQTTKYLLPVVFAVFLAVVLTLGILLMRNSLMKLTTEERSNQLKEMVTQIRANLDSGLHTHWNLMAGLINAAQENHFSNSRDVAENIAHMEKDFCTELYGCRVMFLDEQGTAYLSDGPVGIWYDISHLLDGEKRHTFVSETDTIDGSFLVFSQELDTPITLSEDHARFTHIVLLKDIRAVKQYYTTTTYGGSAATYIIKENGTLAYFDADDDDVIGARNIYKALEEAEYVQGRGFDIIKEQLRIAAGEPISIAHRAPLSPGCHAIEFRINAEDPAKGFMPCPGTITRFDVPGGPGVRVDTHIRAGYKVPPTYDSLLAKLIVWGDTRAEAVARGKRALSEFVIEGVATTIPFHQAVLENEVFLSGEVYTDFIETQMNGGTL